MSTNKVISSYSYVRLNARAYARVAYVWTAYAFLVQAVDRSCAMVYQLDWYLDKRSLTSAIYPQLLHDSFSSSNRTSNQLSCSNSHYSIG
jgi:hypothetical protein